MRLITPQHNRRQEIRLLQGELNALLAERTELRLALEQCLRRLDKLHAYEPDPTVLLVQDVLERTKST